MPAPLFIYVHGFNSSPDSYKARQLIDWLGQQGRGDEIVVPALSHWPEQAIASLEALVQQHRRRNILLLGSSLGGYYSSWLVEKYRLKAVLINPAVRPYELLQELLGENENLYTHERYQLTPEHLDQLLALRCDRIRDLSRYLLLTQTDDEVLDYRQAVELLDGAEMVIEQGGDHGFQHFERYFDRIDQFARQP